MHLHNAFTDVALQGSLDDSAAGADDSNAKADKGSQPNSHRGSGEQAPAKEGSRIDYSNKTPPEKAGGSW